MKLKYIDNPFFKNKDKEKLEKIIDYINNIDKKSILRLSKILNRKISSLNRKKLLALLVLIYLENDYIKLDAINQRILDFEKEILYFKKGKKELITIAEEEEEFVEMYINIGRDKNIFPKDLISFICSSMKIIPRQIQNIRIFDKYSFFKIPKNYHDKAIILLSVKKFRGKNIIVNLSKKKN